MLLAHHVNVVFGVGGRWNGVQQVVQVGGAADLIQFALRGQAIGQGEHINGTQGIRHVLHGGINDLMGTPVK